MDTYLKSSLAYFKQQTEFLDNNKFLIGISMILMNLGSKYLVMDLSKSQEEFFRNTIIRRLTLFAVFYIATRDLMLSLIFTAVFVILTFGLFNDQSRMYVFKKPTESQKQ